MVLNPKYEKVCNEIEEFIFNKWSTEPKVLYNYVREGYVYLYLRIDLHSAKNFQYLSFRFHNQTLVIEILDSERVYQKFKCDNSGYDRLMENCLIK